jgi:hypothetical protein
VSTEPEDGVRNPDIVSEISRRQGGRADHLVVLQRLHPKQRIKVKILLMTS